MFCSETLAACGSALGDWRAASFWTWPKPHSQLLSHWILSVWPCKTITLVYWRNNIFHVTIELIELILACICPCVLYNLVVSALLCLLCGCGWTLCNVCGYYSAVLVFSAELLILQQPRWCSVFTSWWSRPKLWLQRSRYLDLKQRCSSPLLFFF